MENKHTSPRRENRSPVPQSHIDLAFAKELGTLHLDDDGKRIRSVLLRVKNNIFKLSSK